VILYGLGRFGSHLADRLGHTGYRILAVDFDPYCVTANTRDGVTAVFGSAEDIHLLDTLPLARARYVISTIPALDTKGRCCWGNSPQPLQSPDRGARRPLPPRHRRIDLAARTPTSWRTTR
jgi:TrkA-N domain